MKMGVWVRWMIVCVAVGVVRAVGPRTPFVARPAPGPRPGVATGGTGQDRATQHVDRQDSNIALLQELRTITDLILRGQKEEVRWLAPPVVHDCSTLRQAGLKGSGVYQLFPFTFPVYCDMTTEGGGWTVIQRRQPRAVQEDFARDWADYRRGFGSLEGEMWLGLEPLHQLTSSGQYELRIDMVDYQLGPRHALYKVFRVGPEQDGYRLLATNYSGDAGDALSLFHSGRRFSTLDRDQDLARNKSCAQEKESGWWFHACYAAHPNGRYPNLPHRQNNSTEIRWWADRENVLVLTHVEMKVRRRGFSSSEVPLDAADTHGDARHDHTDDDSLHDTSSEEEDTWRLDYDTQWPTGDDTTLDVEKYNVTGRSDTNPWDVQRPSALN